MSTLLTSFVSSEKNKETPNLRIEKSGLLNYEKPKKKYVKLNNTMEERKSSLKTVILTAFITALITLTIGFIFTFKSPTAVKAERNSLKIENMNYELNKISNNLSVIDQRTYEIYKILTENKEK